MVPGTTLVERVGDGKVFAMSFGAGTLAPVATDVTVGLVCCHIGGVPVLSAGVGSSPIFAATFTGELECSHPDPRDPSFDNETFPLVANVLDAQILQEVANTAAPAALPPLQCGDINSSDCCSEFSNAERNGEFLAVCDRCVAEGGAAPLRSRCQTCCAKCPKVTTCFALPPDLPVPPALTGMIPTINLSVPISVPDGRLLMFTYTLPVRGSTCCFEGVVPQLSQTTSFIDSFADRFVASALSCSDGPAAFIDPAVYDGL